MQPTNPTSDKDKDAFLANPLCRALLKDTSYTQYSPASLPLTKSPSPSPSPSASDPGPDPNTSTVPISFKIPNPFVRRTLTHPSSDAVLSTAYIARRNPHPEAHLLLHVGRGVTGQDGIAHGGFLAVVMDEVCGCLISSTEIDGGKGMFTGGLALKYLKPVWVEKGDGDEKQEEKGSVIVATARAERVEGRKVFVSAGIRDKDGELCTTAEAVFVLRRGEAAL
ncbi:HotDog domain-containing protein [Aspergillus unguis]